MRLIPALVLLVGFCASVAWAALPGHVYSDRILSSPVQAIGKLEKLTKTGENSWNEQYEGVFTVEKRVTLPGAQQADLTRLVASGSAKTNEASVPIKFCSAKPNAFPPPSSEICFPGKQDERAFATIDSGGALTSYTPLTPELERALLEEPASLVIGPDRIQLRSEMPQVEPLK